MPLLLVFQEWVWDFQARRASGMKWAIGVALLALALTGCTKTVQEMSYSERKALAGEIVQRCIKQGIDPRSKEMDACTYAEAQREVTTRNMNYIRERQAAAAIGQGLQNAGQSYNQAAANSAAMNRTVTCTRVPSPAGYSTVRCY